MNRMKIIVPPLKSQGIKTKLVPSIKACVRSYQGKWVEPFLGTGIVAFNMRPHNALLCDTNPHIIRFYKDVQSGLINGVRVRDYLTEASVKLITSKDEGWGYFREVRDRFNENHDPLDFLFLSRAGFNGMMRFNRNGNWNIPFCKKPDRFRQAYITKIVNQIDAVAAVINPHWEFRVQDFRATLSDAEGDDLVYCDPPYYGRHADYFNAWTEEDEEGLFEALKDAPFGFILSTWHHNKFRKNDMIEKFWSKFQIRTHEHFYHGGGNISNRNIMVEALVTNYAPVLSTRVAGEQEIFAG